MFTVAVLPVLGLCACVAVYYASRGPYVANTTTLEGYCVVCGLLVTFMQLFATFDQLTLLWPSGVIVVKPEVVSVGGVNYSASVQYAVVSESVANRVGHEQHEEATGGDWAVLRLVGHRRRSCGTTSLLAVVSWPRGAGDGHVAPRRR